MADPSLADHVRTFPETLSASVCRTLIERFDASADIEPSRREGGHSFVQLDLTAKWPDQHAVLLPIFLSYFNKYQAAINARFWPMQFSFEHIRMKCYLPNGVDGFPLHVDVMTHDAARRFMAAFIYLNTPAGGETVFPTLGISVAPETGKLIAFPPLWLFPHAGLPPQGGPKYILHTYLCYPA